MTMEIFKTKNQKEISDIKKVEAAIDRDHRRIRFYRFATAFLALVTLGAVAVAARERR